MEHSTPRTPETFLDPRRSDVVAVAGVVMSLHLVSGRGGSLLAKRYVRDAGKALAAGRLESAGLRPNVVRVGPYYTVYIATADLLRLAERDSEIRRAMALYLAEKAKNGTPRQREIAEKILQRHPFLFSQSPRRLLEAGIAMRRASRAT
jgi:hypothetical protein